jgi:hypothetical protein
MKSGLYINISIMNIIIFIYLVFRLSKDTFSTLLIVLFVANTYILRGVFIPREKFVPKK